MIFNLQPKSREAVPQRAQHATMRKRKRTIERNKPGIFLSIVNEVSKRAKGGGFHENKNRTINGAKYIPIKWWRLMQ